MTAKIVIPRAQVEIYSLTAHTNPNFPDEHRVTLSFSLDDVLSYAWKELVDLWGRTFFDAWEADKKRFGNLPPWDYLEKHMVFGDDASDYGPDCLHVGSDVDGFIPNGFDPPYSVWEIRRHRLTLPDNLAAAPCGKDKKEDKNA